MALHKNMQAQSIKKKTITTTTTAKVTTEKRANESKHNNSVFVHLNVYFKRAIVEKFKSEIDITAHTPVGAGFINKNKQFRIFFTCIKKFCIDLHIQEIWSN